MANPLLISDLKKIYVKPSLGGQLIMRRPRSIQTSKAVKAQQREFAKRMKGNKIAEKCEGKKGRAFYACLKTEGYKAYHEEEEKKKE